MFPTRCPKRSIRPAAWRIAASSASRALHAAPRHEGGRLTARTMTGKSIVDSQFERAANLINLDDYMRRILMRPFREVQVEVPVRMDDGRIEVFTGYRIQHNGARGPCKGGIRYHPEADHDEVLGLATIMTWKTALMDPVRRREGRRRGGSQAALEARAGAP